MADAFITRKGGGGALEITGQEVITGEYQETIAKFDSVQISTKGESQWETSINKVLPYLPGSSFFSRSSDFSPDGTHFALVDIYLQVFERGSNDLFMPTIISENIEGGAGLTGTTNKFNTVKFSSSGDYLAVGGQLFWKTGYTGQVRLEIIKKLNDSFFNALYFPDSQSTLSSQFATISVQPPGNVYDLSFSPDDTYLAVAHDSAPNISIYKRSGDTFTKLPNPAVLLGSNGRIVKFSPDGNYLFVGGDSGAEFIIYKRSGDTFTQLAYPAVLPPFSPAVQAVTSASWTPDSTYLAFSYVDVDYLNFNSANLANHAIIYKRNGDTFTSIPISLTLPGGSIFEASPVLSFSPDGNYLFYTNSFNFIIAKRNGDSFTNVFDSFSFPFNSENRFIGQDPKISSFSPDGKYVSICHIDTGSSNEPYKHTLYKTTVIPTEFKISKANNIINSVGGNLGYALEDGTAGQTKTVVTLFEEE